MNTKKLLRALANRFPKKIAMKYHDFPGKQLGKLKDDTRTVLLCLDFDDEVFNIMGKENLFSKVDMIITHHPFIYGTYAKVTKYDEVKKDLAERMLEKNIPIYSYHTNFDEGKDGMNDALAERLQLRNITPLIEDPMARGGELENEMNVEEFAKYAKQKLGVDYGILLPYGSSKVKKVAIVGGGGWGAYRIAKKEGYDIFISGDIPHHGRRGVLAYQFNYLDLPHEIEKIFVEQFKKVLLEIDSSLEVISIDHEKLPEII